MILSGPASFYSRFIYGYKKGKGVETEGQLDCLIDFKCKEGFFYSKPEPEEEILLLLKGQIK